MHDFYNGKTILLTGSTGFLGKLFQLIFRQGYSGEGAKVTSSD